MSPIIIKERMMMLEQGSQQDSDLYKQLEVIKQDSISTIKQKAALRDKSMLSLKISRATGRRNNPI
jgi:hypothetical protein